MTIVLVLVYLINNSSKLFLNGLWVPEDSQKQKTQHNSIKWWFGKQYKFHYDNTQQLFIFFNVCLRLGEMIQFDYFFRHVETTNYAYI